MSAAESVITAAAFVWLGMVLAISFLEAPLKFRAPDVTVRIGLGIGRIVFRALNTCEAVLAATILVAASLDRPEPAATTALLIAVVVLLVQVAVVRPPLARRSDAVLAGQEGGRSWMHLVYIAFEIVKVGFLAAGGVLTLRG